MSQWLYAGKGNQIKMPYIDYATPESVKQGRDNGQTN